MQALATTSPWQCSRTDQKVHHIGCRPSTVLDLLSAGEVCELVEHGTILFSRGCMLTGVIKAKSASHPNYCSRRSLNPPVLLTLSHSITLFLNIFLLKQL